MLKVARAAPHRVAHRLDIADCFPLLLGLKHLGVALPIVEGPVGQAVAASLGAGQRLTVVGIFELIRIELVRSVAGATHEVVDLHLREMVRPAQIVAVLPEGVRVADDVWTGHGFEALPLSVWRPLAIA